MTTLKIGADPEFFIQDTQGNLKSIIGLLGGTKDNPVAIDDFHGDFKMLEDNVAAEYNIPPASTAEEFIEYIQWPQKYIQTLLNAKNLTINHSASASFPDVELQSKEAWIFGCEPDFNIYTGDKNTAPEAKDKNFRSCGGHVHVGLIDPNNKKEKLNIEQAKNNIKNMDIWLGVWSVIADKDTTRKQLYGKAGAFRPKPYGFEYRVLSNFWIFDPGLIKEVFNRTKEAINDTRNIFLSEQERIINIINTGNVKDATNFGKTYGIL